MTMFHKKNSGKPSPGASVVTGKKEKRKGVLLRRVLLAICLLCVGALSSPAAEVFLVASYHEGDLCGQPQYDAVVEALMQSGIPGLTFRGYYLDSRRRSKDEIDGLIDEIIGDIRKRRPKIVLTIDDLAFARLYGEVLRHPSMYLVFTGLNRSVEEYDAQISFLDERGRPNRNITGVFEYLFMKEQFEMFEVLLQRPIGKVAALHSVDSVGLILKDQIIDELASTPYGERVVFYAAEDVGSVLEHAAAIGADDGVNAWIPLTMSVKDASGKGFLTMSDLAKEMMARISKPDLAINMSFTELGYYGGVSVDFYKMGFQTGIMAAKLLKGHSIREIPIENARGSLMAVNRSRMRMLGIPLPEQFASIVDIFLE